MKKSFVGTKATVRQLSDKKAKVFFYEHAYNNAHNMEPENTMLSLRRNIAGKRFTEADKQVQY